MKTIETAVSTRWTNINLKTTLQQWRLIDTDEVATHFGPKVSSTFRAVSLSLSAVHLVNRGSAITLADRNTHVGRLTRVLGKTREHLVILRSERSVDTGY